MLQRQLFKKTTFIEEQPTINNMFRTGIAQVPHLHSLSVFFCSHVMDLSCAHFLQVGVDDVLIYWFIFPWSKKWRAWRNLKLQTPTALIWVSENGMCTGPLTKKIWFSMIFLCINGDYLWWMTSVLCSLFSTSSTLIMSCVAAPQQWHRGSEKSGIAPNSENCSEESNKDLTILCSHRVSEKTSAARKRCKPHHQITKWTAQEMERCEEKGNLFAQVWTLVVAMAGSCWSTLLIPISWR